MSKLDILESLVGKEYFTINHNKDSVSTTLKKNNIQPNNNRITLLATPTNKTTFK